MILTFITTQNKGTLRNDKTNGFPNHPSFSRVFPLLKGLFRDPLLHDLLLPPVHAPRAVPQLC